MAHAQVRSDATEIDLGWLRVMREAQGWRVVSSRHISLQDYLKAGDLVRAVDNIRIETLDTLLAARVLNEIQTVASRVEVVRDNRIQQLTLRASRSGLIGPVGEYLYKTQIDLSQRKAQVITLPEAFGGTTTVELNGSWTVVHVWSSRCPLCIGDIAALNEIRNSVPEKVRWQSIALDDDDVSIRDFSKDHPIRFSVLLAGKWDNSNAFSRQFGISAVPTYIVFDPLGEIPFVAVGENSLSSTVRFLKKASLLKK
jgi:hypothetical protein